GDREQFDVYNGSIVPGEHTLTVNLEYRGHGHGVFTYLKGYRFKVRSNYSFNAPEGRSVTVKVVGYEKGGPTAPLEERPAIRYIEHIAGADAAAAKDK
ncbi:MAG: dihydrolipoamide acetyltransferase, partial [Myxococcales bacterium]|nr:dihydrolipoamide acetyltransferase [Myxococcales bacterium]